MFDKTTCSPLDLEKELGPDPDIKATVPDTNTYSISVENVNGEAVMNWTASTVGEYDWVGLYGGPNYFYKDYVEWHWVGNNTTQNTGLEFQANFQARYFVWVSDCNTCGGDYVTVAVSST